MSVVTMRVVGTRADLERLEDAARAAVDDCGLPPAVATEVAAALDDVLSNVVLHGFADGRRHEVRLALAPADGEVVVTVEDDGPPFDPLSLPPPDLQAPLETRPVGGLGVHLVRRLMDDVAYARVDGWNRLVLRKCWAPVSR